MKNKNINKANSAVKAKLQEAKFQKRFLKSVNVKGIVNPNLLTNSVISSGFKNQYSETKISSVVDLKNIDSKLKDFKKDLKTADIKNKRIIRKEMTALHERVHSIKDSLKGERSILQKEVKQIYALNKKPKGLAKRRNKAGDIITVKNLNKYYENGFSAFHVLKNIDLSIKKGSFNVIYGASGSGKTSLLNMITGLDRTTYGEVIINGFNISALTTRQLTHFRRMHIGFIFQSYNLLSSLNVNDNIEIGRTLQSNPDKKKDIETLLNTLSMENTGKSRTFELSGGQQQRVSIARALAKNPDILIGDEPTGALDRETSLKVFQLFQEINRKEKTTIIVVTHNPSIAKFADQIIHVKNGEIDKIVQNKPVDASKIKEL